VWGGEWGLLSGITDKSMESGKYSVLFCLVSKKTTKYTNTGKHYSTGASINNKPKILFKTFQTKNTV
jgi:hypothetical protein